jgi:hypothetical protein
MVTRKLPYEGLDLMEAGLAIISGKVLEIPRDCPMELASIMKACWNMKADTRPDFQTMYLYKILETCLY